MTYRTETRTVYVTEDGQEFDNESAANRAVLRKELENWLGSSTETEEMLGRLTFDAAARRIVQDFIATYDDPKPALDDGWIEWTEENRQANIPPVPYGELLCLKLADGSCSYNYQSDYCNWGKISYSPESEIIAYRVIPD